MRGTRIAAMGGLLILATGWLAGTASAQCDLRAEIERALLRIERAREIVSVSPVPEARELLRAAEQRAKEAEERGRRREMERACLLARVSQDLAEKAASVGREGLRDLPQVQNSLERTALFLAEVARELEGNGSREARQMLATATRQQRQGERALDQGRPRMALKLTFLARETARRARRTAQGGEDPGRPWVEQELNLTDRLLEEAAPAGEGEEPPPARVQRLEQARRLQTQARRQLAGGELGLALRLTGQARILARRALRGADPSIAPREVRSMIQTTAELIDRLSTVAAEKGDRSALQSLAKAESLLEDAGKALATGKTHPALGSARAASALALDVSERLSDERRE
jgi:hypothetical protein